MKIYKGSYSQADQESFVLNILKEKRNGVYVEIGAMDSKEISNTYLLEKEFGWAGVGLEIIDYRAEEYNLNRSNPCLNVDATTFDYLKYFEENNFPKRIDYLQVDIEPAFQSLKALKALPLDEYRFSVITFEHDLYADPNNYLIKEEAKALLLSLNYTLVVENVSHQNAIFEDWWVDTQILEDEQKDEEKRNISRSERFDKVYNESHWGYKSGPGSDPDFAKPWIDVVNSFLSKDDVNTVIDVGCGDWRIGKKLNLNGINYTGIEISSVIFKETVLNSFENIKFIQGDFESMSINDVDLIIIKDVLQHLPNSSIYNIVSKIMRKSKYALFCDDMTEVNNEEDVYAGYRSIDLSSNPFNFNFEILGAFGDKVIRLYTRDGENNGGIS